MEGLPAWLGLNAYVELTSIMRQLGPMQADFRRAMLSVAEGPVTPDDCNNLASRMRFAVTPDEAPSFNEAVHFFHTKAATPGPGSDCNLKRHPPRESTRPITQPSLQVRAPIDSGISGSFDDAVHFSPTNAAADAWTWERLQTLARPIARINGSRNQTDFAGASAEFFRDLRPISSSRSAHGCS